MWGRWWMRCMSLVWWDRVGSAFGLCRPALGLHFRARRNFSFRLTFRGRRQVGFQASPALNLLRGRVSSIPGLRPGLRIARSAVAESLFFASPKKSNQKKGDPSIALRFAQFPALLAGLGPARPSEAKAQARSGRARTSMCSNIRAFPPSPAPLLGAMTGPKVKS